MELEHAAGCDVDAGQMSQVVKLNRLRHFLKRGNRKDGVEGSAPVCVVSSDANPQGRQEDGE